MCCLLLARPLIFFWCLYITRVVVTIIIVLKSHIAHITDNKSWWMDKIGVSTTFPGMGISIPAMYWTVDHVASDERGVAMLHVYIVTLHAVWFEKHVHVLFLRIHLVVGYKWKIGVTPSPITVWSLSKCYICPWNAPLANKQPPFPTPSSTPNTNYMCAV